MSRKEIEARLSDIAAIPEVVEHIVETTNSMINLEMIEGDLITFNSIIKEALIDELFSKLETLMSDEDLEEYVAVLEKHSEKLISAVEHITEVVKAQSEKSDYVQM